MSDRDPVSSHLAPAPNSPPTAPGTSLAARGTKVWQDGDTTSFRDVLAIANPLQHIPIVGSIYRAISSDEIALMPSLIGGVLFGGPIGFVLSLANGAFKAETGRDAGETVIAGIFGAKTPAGAPAEPPPAQAIARAPSPPPALRSPDGPGPAGPTPLSGAPAELQMAKASPVASPPPLVIDIPAPKWATDAAAAKAGLPLAPQSPLSARFRSTDLPQPVAEGGGLARSGDDLVPAANGTPITRDAVPTAMMSALDKYGAMMRARTAAATPTQVSLLR